MKIPEMLDILKQREHLQTTGSGKNFWRQERRTSAGKHFVEKCRELGYPVYEMEIREDFYDDETKHQRRWGKFSYAGR